MKYGHFKSRLDDIVYYDTIKCYDTGWIKNSNWTMSPYIRMASGVAASGATGAGGGTPWTATKTNSAVRTMNLIFILDLPSYMLLLFKSFW